MKNYICITCGTQYPESAAPPAHCPICEDDRQYVSLMGQQWTILEELCSGHHNLIKVEEPQLTGIGAQPGFAIGQRALLIQSPHGNVLWDCQAVIDDQTITAIQELGGVSAMAVSHPHFYSTMVEWSRAFGGAPIHLHAANREWVMRPDAAIRYWEGDTFQLQPGITLIRSGGHFPGSTALHWAAGAEGRGVLLTGDTIMVAMDRRYVSFMYSFPNLVPLSAAAVRQVAQSVEPFPYDRIYSGWFEKVILAGARQAVDRSVARYIQAIS